MTGSPPSRVRHALRRRPDPRLLRLTNRHRLNRGVDRHANAALYRVVPCRLRWDPRTRAYMEVRRIAQRLAPEAIEERKREATRLRRLEVWDTPSGTADLALCDVASEDAHAIYNKITAAAHGIRTDGDTRPLNAIRADLAAQLLHGAELPDAIRVVLEQGCDEPASTPPDANGSPTNGRSPASRQSMDHVGPRSPKPRNEPDGTSDDLSGDPRIAVLADEVDRRLRHVHARVQPRELPHAIRRTVQRIHRQFSDARDAVCRGGDEVHGRPGYRPPAAMRREVEARHPTCVFPTCNQPSHRCDLDHTVPWRPGTTCRCNLAPLCRRHHRLKQRADWRLSKSGPDC